ncbi:hypothetical protein [uncultured Ruegeria sp.]|uniref:hypothetical protein n=1 Tax=uncultured Ruegeria sp. TaxID=259304 RepID=UPI002626D653|nr:hypothetical protein [uncultured Ruegeria sp.]
MTHSKGMKVSSFVAVLALLSLPLTTAMTLDRSEALASAAVLEIQPPVGVRSFVDDDTYTFKNLRCVGPRVERAVDLKQFTKFLTTLL